VEAETEEELVAAVRSADEPVLILAGGSNVVIADAGFDGTVVAIQTRGVERLGLRDGRVAVSVVAGELWEPLVESLVADGLAGVEALSGIPGSTGATPIQNVGAYGQEVSETITAVRVLDRGSGEVVVLPPEECGFGYRRSAFKHRDTHVVLSVTFALRPDTLGEPVRYAELARTLGVELGARAPLGDVRAAVLELRRGKGMVIDPDDPDTRSAGSFFTNPVVSRADFDALAARAGADPPAWPEPDGEHVKTSAAWLIQQAGFARGFRVGGAAISSKHVLALTNPGGATTADLLALARAIRDGVRKRFGVELVPEPVLVGETL
jgi:UDP-N-acetylmuramate dehydrogenase